MEKKTSTTFILILLVLFSSNNLSAQITDKLDFFLYQYTKDELMTNSKIDILVQGDIQQIQSITEKTGGDFKYSHGDIACVKVYTATIIELDKSIFVQRIERPNT
ncbi:MAG: hypothetical protein ACKOKB_07400, partial [Bacteroidota bacterium]